MSQTELHYWADCPLPPMRLESHYGDRLVRCFAERPPTFHALLERAVANHPERDALVCGDTRWSYRELDRRVGALAAGLASRGIGTGDRVVLFLSNRPEFIVALFATQRVGAITVPVSVRERRDGLAYMLNQCGARAIVFDVDLAERLPEPSDAPCLQLRVACKGPSDADARSLHDRATAHVVDYEALCDVVPTDRIASAQGTVHSARTARTATAEQPSTAAAAARIEPGANATEENTAVILYTSGTTGRPKGAMLTHLNIVHSALHFVTCMRLTEQDRSIMAVPASHVTGLIANIASFVAVGGATIIMPAFNAAEFLALAARERMTHSLMVPAMYNLSLLQPDVDAYDLGAWRIGGYGGAPMPVATIDALARKLPNLVLMNAYGATETTSPTTMIPAGRTREHADSVGVPLPCADVVVVDDDGRELPRGEVGELWISGPMVVRGYWDNPEATAREFTAGFWHSGDLGSIDADGFVRVLDRKKDMLNRGGYKIYSVEVENLLLSCPGVVEAAVVGKPCPVLGERVHAFVHVGAGSARGTRGAGRGAAVDEASLRAFCAAHLADYKVPESITFTDEPLPRNANGKLLKRVLRERLVG